MKPKTLFPVGPATAGLTGRQQAALELLQAHPAGLRAIDLGRMLHLALSLACSCTETPSATVSCKYAHQAGEEVGKALRKKDLAIKRRTGLWQSTVRAAVAETPWPEWMF